MHRSQHHVGMKGDVEVENLYVTKSSLNNVHKDMDNAMLFCKFVS